MSNSRPGITAGFAVFRSALWGAGIPFLLSLLFLIAYVIFPPAEFLPFLIYVPAILLGKLGIPNVGSVTGNWAFPAAMLINSLCGATAFALVRLAWELCLTSEVSRDSQEAPVAKSPLASSAPPSSPSSPPGPGREVRGAS